MRIGSLKFNNHCKSIEDQYIAAYGVQVDIKVFASEVNCTAPGCGYDSFLRSAIDPNCTICSGTGKVKTYTSHVETVVPHWITESDISDVSIGVVKVGSLKLTARYETLDWWKDAIKRETVLTIDGNQVIAKNAFPSVLKSKVTVYCSNTDLTAA